MVRFSVYIFGILPLIMAGHCCEDKLQNEDLVANFANGNGKFVFDLYKTVNKDNSQNVFLSPFSVTMALAMSSIGAQGSTAEELTTSLGLDTSLAERNEAVRSILLSLCLDGNASTPSSFTLELANRIFVEKTFSLLENFKSDLANYYLSSIEPLDFKNNQEVSRKCINKWVEQTTKDKIKNLLPQGSISIDTRLVLANAIYFKGSWNQKFNPNLTRNRGFFVNGVQQEQVPVMVRKAEFPMSESEEMACKIIELNYVGNRLAMYVILPNNMNGLSALEQQLTIDSFNNLRKSLIRTRTVILSLPKFKLELGLTLSDALKEIGIQNAFSSKANFKGISGDDSLYISDIFHKAFVDVNEEGTEAAAATGAVFNALSFEIDMEFKADHPFLFVICDKLTGLILFIGRLTDPRTLQ